jgi:hypothetical protein
MKRFVVFVFITFLALSKLATAQVTIYGISIPGLHQKNGKGKYDIIINKTVIKTGQAILKIAPPARAENNFKICTNCCFSPANKNPEFYDFGSGYVQTEPMATAKIYIWTKRGSQPISNLEDLKGKKVGIRRGMPYGKTFENSGLNTQDVNNIEQNIIKLEKGRIDAFIAYVPDAYNIFKDIGMVPLPHDKNNPIAIHEDSLVCKGVSSQFIKDFNRMLKSLN